MPNVITTLRAWLIREDLIGGRACDDALEWLDGLPTDVTIPQIVDVCRCGSWLLWAGARAGVRPDHLSAAARPRRERAPRAATPGVLPDDASPEDAAAVAWAEAEAEAEDEHARCADDVRAAIGEELIARLQDVLGGGICDDCI